MGFWAGLPPVKPEIPTGREIFIDIEILGGVFAAGGRIGDLTIDNTLTLASGGVIRSASSGQRVEITEGDKDRISFYTGDSLEGTFPGNIQGVVSGSGATRTIQTSIRSPASTTGTDGGTFIILRTESADDSTTTHGIIFGTDSGSSQTGVVGIQNNMDLTLASGSYIHVGGLGAVGDLVLGIGTSHDDGIYSPSDGQIGIALAGTLKVKFNTTRVEFDVGDLATIQIPTKSDTGDPSSPVNGDLYVNVQDNKVRCYADGSWRDLATW